MQKIKDVMLFSFNFRFSC